MKYALAVTLSTFVLGIVAAPAASDPAAPEGSNGGQHLARAEHGYFNFLRAAARAESSSSSSNAKASRRNSRKTKPSKTRDPGSIITSAPQVPGGNNTNNDNSPSSSFAIRASSSKNDTSGGGGGSGGGDMPAASGTTVLSAVKTIAAGESFDGGMAMFDRGVSCTGQEEGGSSDAVFLLEAGASISNVIIGPNQIEGIHCNGGCRLDNVWWSAVCEDAFTIKEQEAGQTTTIMGGGAAGAEDKVLQHNGAGTLSVSGFTVSDFGKLYRSCGNCKSMSERHVILDNISASDGKLLAGINSNYGDTATLTNIVASSVKEVCTEYEGNDSGDEPTEDSSGPSTACKYSTSDIQSS